MAQCKPFTSPRPAGVPDALAEALKAEALAKLWNRGRRGMRWSTTGELDLPGWVMGELYAERRIEGRRLSGSSPNEWRG
jgi:hypothetical protein